MTVIIVSRATAIGERHDPRNRVWIHDGHRWRRPNEASLATTKHAPGIFGRPPTATNGNAQHADVYWRYHDERPGGEHHSDAPIEFRIRHGCFIWFIP